MCLTLVFVIAIVCCEGLRKRFPYNLIALGILTLLYAYMLAAVSCIYDTVAVSIFRGIIMIWHSTNHLMTSLILLIYKLFRWHYLCNYRKIGKIGNFCLFVLWKIDIFIPILIGKKKLLFCDVCWFEGGSSNNKYNRRQAIHSFAWPFVHKNFLLKGGAAYAWRLQYNPSLHSSHSAINWEGSWQSFHNKINWREHHTDFFIQLY